MASASACTRARRRARARISSGTRSRRSRRSSAIRSSGLRHHLGAALYPESPARWAAAGLPYDSTIILNHEQGYPPRHGRPVPLERPACPSCSRSRRTGWTPSPSTAWRSALPASAPSCLSSPTPPASGALEGVVWHDVPMTYTNREDGIYRALLARALDAGGLVGVARALCRARPRAARERARRGRRGRRAGGAARASRPRRWRCARPGRPPSSPTRTAPPAKTCRCGRSAVELRR